MPCEHYPFVAALLDEVGLVEEVGGEVLPAHGTPLALVGHALDAEEAEDVSAGQPDRVHARLQAHGALQPRRGHRPPSCCRRVWRLHSAAVKASKRTGLTQRKS